MRTTRLRIPAAVALLALVAGSGCLLVPQIKDKTVDLVAGGEFVTTFTALGILNTFEATQGLDLRDEIDIPATLDAAGLAGSQVKSITVSGVAYRVTRAQAGRTIADGKVTIQRAGGASAVLVPAFTADAGAVTGWIAPPLDPAGVAQLDALLADVVTELHGGAPANEAFAFTVSGTSNPQDAASDFALEFRMTISIVGTVKTKWLE